MLNLFLKNFKGAVVAIVLLAVLTLWGVPTMWVYFSTMGGKAELKRAEQNRQIKVEEARATQEAAKMLAAAEIERAKGAAEANKIIGESLKGNEAYLKYLWINGLQEGATPQVIYVPTEAGLPILEAGKR